MEGLEADLEATDPGLLRPELGPQVVGLALQLGHDGAFEGHTVSLRSPSWGEP